MECGDPRGAWGQGLVPIRTDLLHLIKEKELSVYTCHAPLDVHEQVSTSQAIAEQIGAQVLEPFFPYGNGNAGLICAVKPISTENLIDKLKNTFDIPYVDFGGKSHERIEKIAIVAGCGDVVAEMKEAESKLAQAYITGEIHCHIDNEKGKTRFQQMKDYLASSTMSAIGVSHAASEYLIMKTQMRKWFEQYCQVEVNLIPQLKWWT
jgi:putative NIF3 family GTP cyclohydrolase 1 type 2